MKIPPVAYRTFEQPQQRPQDGKALIFSRNCRNGAIITRTSPTIITLALSVKILEFSLENSFSVTIQFYTACRRPPRWPTDVAAFKSAVNGASQ